MGFVLWFVFSALSTPGAFILFLTLFCVRDRSSGRLVRFRSGFIFVAGRYSTWFIIFGTDIGVLLALCLVLFVRFFRYILIFQGVITPPTTIVGVEVPGFRFLFIKCENYSGSRVTVVLQLDVRGNTGIVCDSRLIVILNFGRAFLFIVFRERPFTRVPQLWILSLVGTLLSRYCALICLLVGLVWAWPFTIFI